MPKRKLDKKFNKKYINPRRNKYMGHSPKEKPIKKLKSIPHGLCSGTITSLLPTGVPRIYSHQQADDHRKREYHTANRTHNNKSRVS